MTEGAFRLESTQPGNSEWQLTAGCLRDTHAPFGVLVTFVQKVTISNALKWLRNPLYGRC